jgi:DNA-binding MarR family transcriptional regulator
MIIRANPGCTQTAMGEALSVNRASAMKLVNYLEGRGLVKRMPGADSRANALHLTADGKVQLEQMQDALARSDGAILSALSRTEARQMLRTIRKLRDAIQALD